MSLAAISFAAYLLGWVGHVLYRRIFGKGMYERLQLERDEAVGTMTSYYDRVQKLEAANRALQERVGRCDFSVDKGAYMCELTKGHDGPCGSLPNNLP